MPREPENVPVPKEQVYPSVAEITEAVTKAVMAKLEASGFAPSTAEPTEESPQGEHGLPIPIDFQEHPEDVTASPGKIPGYLPEALVKRIKEDKYVDLNEVLTAMENFTGLPEQLTLAAQKTQDGTSMVFKTSKKRKIFNIQQWNKAFYMYLKVRGTAFPDEHVAMMDYMKIIADIAEEKGNWYWYDIQFRWRRRDNTLKWDKLDEELYMKSHFRPNIVTVQGKQPQRNSSFRGRHKIGYCWKYQEGRRCHTSCPHKHVCENCERKHWGKQCNTSSTASTSSTQGSSTYGSAGTTQHTAKNVPNTIKPSKLSTHSN